MCSPISPVLADYRDALLAALTEVAENSLFAFADVSDAATFDAAAAAPLTEGGSPWLRSSVDFRGSIAGRLELTIPEPLAQHLCAAFAGAETVEELAEGDLIDFTGELSNMVCGAWLTRAYRHEAFSLKPPHVSRGQPDGAKPADAASEQFYLSIDEAPIRLELHWEPADSPAKDHIDGR